MRYGDGWGAHSENGIGTTVTVILPAVDARPHQTGSSGGTALIAATAVGTAPHETILMDEDEDEGAAGRSSSSFVVDTPARRDEPAGALSAWLLKHRRGAQTPARRVAAVHRH